jgi:hypothetical protein
MISLWFCAMVAWTFMIWIVLGCLVQTVQADNGINKHRALLSCGQIDFAVFNSASNTSTKIGLVQYMSEYPRARILLDKYPNGMISIITNVDTSGCPAATVVQCVNTTFGTFRQSIDRVVPYTLYGDNPVTGQIYTRKPANTSFQLLSAKAYSTANCTGIPIAETTNDIHLVPKSVATIRSTRFTAVYNGTVAPKSGVLAKYTNAVVNATCQYIRESLGYGFVYKGSLSHDFSAFKCLRVSTANATTGNATATSPSLRISYQIVATFRIGEYITPYLNQNMPTSQQLSSFITALFSDHATRGPGDSMYMSEYLRGRIVLPNTYSNFTRIVLV